MSDAKTDPLGAWIAEYRALADIRLAQVLAPDVSRLEGLPFGTAPYLRHTVEYALRGGKRLRGVLVTLGYEAVGGGERREALDASLAFELVHAFLLAYDDVMDRDEVRRGGKALHVLLREDAAQAGSREPEHRALSMTLLCGMSLQYAAVRLLAESPNAHRTVPYLNRVLHDVTIGQMLDVCAADSKGATLADQQAIQRLKTGVYTTEGPLVLGALLGGADEGDARVKALRAYAEPLGEAFQIVDDVLGIVGDPAETGKPVAGDLREGKRTAVVEATLEALTGSARRRFGSLVGRALTPEETLEARALVMESGAVDLVRDRAKVLADKAIHAISRHGIAPAAHAALVSLARLIVERQN